MYKLSLYYLSHQSRISLKIIDEMTFPTVKLANVMVCEEEERREITLTLFVFLNEEEKYKYFYESKIQLFWNKIL